VAIAMLPSFQVGVYVALFVAASLVIAWRPFVVGLSALVGSQIVALVVLQLVTRHGLTPHVRDVRAWALAAPLLVMAAMVKRERPLH
jgi:peptidoglycan/LPS O-acetylase OafA/YrhL